MLNDLFVAFPALRSDLDCRAEWAGVLPPPSAFTPEAKAAQKAAITDARVAQPTLGITGMAMADLLGRLGVHPAMAAGHSYGELVAATPGVISQADLLALSRKRAEAILSSTGLRSRRHGRRHRRSGYHRGGPGSTPAPTTWSWPTATAPISR